VCYSISRSVSNLSSGRPSWATAEKRIEPVLQSVDRLNWINSFSLRGNAGARNVRLPIFMPKPAKIARRRAYRVRGRLLQGRLTLSCLTPRRTARNSASVRSSAMPPSKFQIHAEVGLAGSETASCAPCHLFTEVHAKLPVLHIHVVTHIARAAPTRANANTISAISDLVAQARGRTHIDAAA